MLKNKRGLSTVVTTLIIILLVLVAIGIIWIVVRGVIEDTSGTINYNAKCLKVAVVPQSVACYQGSTGDFCNITLGRTQGDEEIGGVVLIFHNTTTDESSDVIESSGDITLLGKRTEENIEPGFNYTNKVDVVPYFLDDSGERRLCDADIRSLIY